FATPRCGDCAEAADPALAMATVEPVAVRFKPDECRILQSQMRQDAIAVQPDNVAVAGVAPALLCVAETQFEKLSAEDITCAKRCGRIPEAVALAGPRHADVDFAEHDNVGPRFSNGVAAGVEVMETLRVPVGDAKRTLLRDGCFAAGLDELQRLDLGDQLTVYIKRRREGEHAIPRGLIDDRDIRRRASMY